MTDPAPDQDPPPSALSQLVRYGVISLLVIVVLVVAAVLLLGGQYLPFDYEGF